MDIEEGGIKGNETILLKLSDDDEKGNRTEGVADEELNICNPDYLL